MAADKSDQQTNLIRLDEFSLRGRARNIFKMSVGIFIFINAVAIAYLPIFGTTGKDWVTEYNIALYWTVTTLTTVGYGDITPSDNLSRAFTMFVMLAGVALYGIVIGRLAEFFVRVDRRAEAKREALQQLTDFFRHYDVPRELQEQSFTLVQHLLSQRAADEEEKILDALPDQLQGELRTQMLLKRLSSVSLFEGCSRDCLVAVTQKLHQVFAAPNQKIVSEGEDAADLFLIGWGEALVHHGNEKVAVLKAGDCFGEMALVQEEKRGADVTAMAYCDLHRLNKNDFNALLQNHPDLRRNVESIVERRRAQAS